MKKINFRKQYLACAVLAAICTGFIYTPQMAEAKFGVAETISTFDIKDVVTFVGKSWYVVGQSNAGGDNNKITLFCKDVWNTDTIKFNVFKSGTDNVFNDYGSVPYKDTRPAGEASNLMQKMQALYDELEAGTAKNAIQKVEDLSDVNVQNVYFYAPSKTEVESYMSLTLPDDAQFPSDNSVARATADYWTRSPDTNTEHAIYYNKNSLMTTYESATDGQFALRPVIQVSQTAAGSTLVNTDPTKTSGSYFSAKGGITSGTAFKGEASSGDVVKYEIAKDSGTAVEGPALTVTGTLVLDGSKITVAHGAAPDGFAVAAVLVNENDVVMASDSTFATIDSKIDYIATLDGGIGDLSEVSNATYGMKIFGVDTTTGAEKATQLGSGVINGIQKTDNGLNLTIGKLNDTTIYNAGFEVISLSNGAGVTLAGDASNAITVTGGTGKINLAGKTLSGTITNDSSTLEIAGGEAGKINGIVGTDGTTVIKSGSVESTGAIANKIEVKNDAFLSVGATNLQNEVTNSGTVNLADGTLSKKVTGGMLNIKGNVTSDAENIAGATNTVDAEKTLTVTGTTASSTTGILTNAVGGAGKIVIDGTITAIERIETTGGITVNTGNSLDIKASNVGADVTNSGTVNLIDTGTLSKKVTGGELNIKGNVTSDAENIAGATNTVDTGKTLTVIGTGILAKVTGAGSTVINGTITAQDTISTTGGITVNSGKSLAIGAEKVGANITNNGTVKLGAGTLYESRKITNGIVEIGTADGPETVSVKTSQFENVSSIKINNNDTLNFTGSVASDVEYSNITGNGKMDVATSGDGKIVLNGDKILTGITITSGNLQIPAEWILSGSVGSYTITDNGYITGDNTDSVLTLKLANGNKWKLTDLNTVTSTTDGIGSNYTGKVKFDGEFDPDGATISVKSTGGAISSTDKIGIYNTDGTMLYPEDGSSLSVPENYVNVANKDENPYNGTPINTSLVSISGATDFVAKALVIDHSGDVTLEIKDVSKVTLCGGDGVTPLVEKNKVALNTTVKVASGSTFNVGQEDRTGKGDGLKIKTLNNNGTVNMYNANMKFDGGITNDGAGSVFNAKNSVIEVGGKLTVNGTATLESTDLKVTGTDGINVGGEFNMNGGTLRADKITGNGTFNANSGDLYVKKSSVSKIQFGDGLNIHISLPEAQNNITHIVNGAFYDVQSFTDQGSELHLDGTLTEGSYYVIVSGNGVNNVDGKQTVWEKEDIYTSDAGLELVPITDPDAEISDFNVFKNMIVLKAIGGDILMSEKKLAPYYPVMQAIVDDTNSEANKLYADVKNAYRRGNRKGGAAAMENLFCQPNVASVFKSGMQVASLISDATLDHTSLVERNVNYSSNHYKPSLRNIVANSPDMDSDPEYIGIGKVTEIMPYRENKKYNSQQNDFGSNKSIQRNYYGSYKDDFRSSASAASSIRSHGGGGGGGSRKSSNTFKTTNNYSGGDDNKQIWASYLHSKEEIDGLKTGSTKREGTNTTNGAVVGVDLWSSEHAFGGLSVSYAKTDVETGSDFGKITNDVETYGVGIYHRHDYRTGAVIFDGGYTHNKNEIKQTMNLVHSYEIEAKPEVEIFDAGLRYEHKCHVDENAAVVPYVGVRYTMVDPESYCNNVGIRYGTRRDDIISVPVGLRLSVNWHTSDSVIVKPYVDLGYKWNVGHDDWQQKVIYGNAMSKMKYDVLDKRCFFWNAGLQIIGNTFTFGAGYHYSSSENVKNRQWTINANWEM